MFSRNRTLKSQVLVFLFVIGGICGILIEDGLSGDNNLELQCDFNDRTLAESVRFMRSPYSCRVYHICAFYKQYTLTCAEGLFFDEQLDSCNFESAVECNLVHEQVFNNSAVDDGFNSTYYLISLNNETEATNTFAAYHLSTNNSSYNPPETATPFSFLTSPVTYLLFTYGANNEVPPVESNVINNNVDVVSENKTISNEITDGVFSTSNVNFSGSSEPVFVNNQQEQSTIISDLDSTTAISTTVSHSSDIDLTTLGDKILQTSTLSIEPSSPSDAQISVSVAPATNTWWISPTECISGFDHKIPHQNNCGLYYECTSAGEKTERACPYPYQFDEFFNECRNYDQVECGLRPQAKDLCDYKLSNSQFNTVPCSMYPSCKNLSDGLYPSNDCRNYYQCKDERTLRTFTCPQNKTTGVDLRFNIMTRRCDYIENVPFNCGGYAITVDIYSNQMVCPSQQSIKQSVQGSLSLELKDLYFSHPRECGIYFECDIYGNMTVLECANGTHFSPVYQTCVHPSIANCRKLIIMDESPVNSSIKFFYSKLFSRLTLADKKSANSNDQANPIENTTTTKIMTPLESVSTTDQSETAPREDKGPSQVASVPRVYSGLLKNIYNYNHNNFIKRPL